MPETIADRPEANGSVVAMPEPAPGQLAEIIRRHMQDAENAGSELFGPTGTTHNDLVVEAIRFYFDTLEKIMRENMEITARARPATEDIMALYRRTYMDGLNFQQAYWQGVSRMFARRWG